MEPWIFTHYYFIVTKIITIIFVLPDSQFTLSLFITSDFGIVEQFLQTSMKKVSPNRFVGNAWFCRHTMWTKLWQFSHSNREETESTESPHVWQTLDTWLSVSPSISSEIISIIFIYIGRSVTLYYPSLPQDSSLLHFGIIKTVHMHLKIKTCFCSRVKMNIEKVCYCRMDIRLRFYYGLLISDETKKASIPIWF